MPHMEVLSIHQWNQIHMPTVSMIHPTPSELDKFTSMSAFIYLF